MTFWKAAVMNFVRGLLVFWMAGAAVWLVVQPQFLVSRYWVKDHLLTSVAVGGALTVLLFVVGRHFPHPKASEEHRQRFSLSSLRSVAFGIGSFVFLTCISATWVLEILPFALTINEAKDRSESTRLIRSSNTRGMLAWSPEGGAVIVRQVRNVPSSAFDCAQDGSFMRVFGHGSSIGIHVDRVEVHEPVGDEKIVVDWTAGTVNLPERCSRN